MPYDLELEQAVEKLQKSDAPVVKSELYLAMKKFANRQRLSGESEQQAFTKFITSDPLGKQLYAKYAQTRGVSVPIAKTGMQDGSDIDGDADGGETEHMKTLREIASKIQQKHPELRLTKSSAMAIAITTPLGREAYEADRRARLRAA